MIAVVNPLVPAGFDLFWSGVVALMLALVVMSIVSIVRHARRLDELSYVLWIIAVLALPVVGSLLWFSFGRRGVRLEASR